MESIQIILVVISTIVVILSSYYVTFTARGKQQLDFNPYDMLKDCQDNLANANRLIMRLRNNGKNNITHSVEEEIVILDIAPNYANSDNYEELDNLTGIATIAKSTFSLIALVGDETTRSNILNELQLNDSINIVQIDAHANNDFIVLNGKVNNLDEVPVQWFAKVLTRYNIKVVILFSCESDILVDKLFRLGINCVIGFHNVIDDNTIKTFVNEFYKFLSNHSTVDAVELATLSIEQDILQNIVIRGDYNFGDNK